MIKQKKDEEIIRNRKKRTTLEKLTMQLEGINQKVLVKEGRLKRYRQRVKQYRQNRKFQNNERTFYQQLGGDDTKTYQQQDAKETQRFWTKLWQAKNIRKRLNGLDKQYDKRTRRTWRRPESGNTHRTTQKKKNTKKDIKLENAWTWSYLPNPSARAGYDTRSIFKRSLTGLNSEFSFS